MSRTPVVALLLVLLAPVAHATCSLNVRFTDNPPTLTWDSVGASSYLVQESFDDLKTSRNYFVNGTTFRIQRRASANVHVTYSITAILKPNISALANASDACVEQLSVQLRSDPAFRALTRKAVVPIAGSGPGANGGRFKTHLKLTGTAPGQTGTIVFHPANAVASASDPLMRFSLDAIGATTEIDDVVAAMGASGIGSLDIIPDERERTSEAVPAVEARLYNDTSSGTFGTTLAGLVPFDFLDAPNLTIPVLPSDSLFRINAGFRTLADTKLSALIYGTNGRVRDLRTFQFPADYTAFGTLTQILGVALQPGERVIMTFDGAAIPFYTRTENRTNDPDLFIPPHTQSTNVVFID